MRKLITVAAVTLSLSQAAAPDANAFDIDTDNGAVDVVIMSAVGPIFQDLSPTGGDATLVLRATTMITNAWFDATAPYHPSAVGVYSRIANQPAEATTRNLNTALIHASYHALNSIFPNRKAEWDQMMVDAGLDPLDTSTDVDTAVGIGNVAGMAVVAGRERDGMNQLGDEISRDFNPMPYADYTGYRPKNTAYKLMNRSRWQPDIQRQGAGLYKVQQFVTPQYALVEPYSYDDPADFSVPAPVASLANNGLYEQQADEVLAASAALTDEQKLKAELFDNKIFSLGFSAVFAAQTKGLSLLEFVQLDFLTNMAAFDAGVFIWRAKRQYDAVRPFSAIRKIYGDADVLAWGGPGEGTTVLPASEWKSYLEEADHPEYPSASACFCAAHTRSARLYLGTDSLAVPGGPPGFPTFYAAGSSRIEPGITPAVDTTLFYPTWTEFNQDCGQSRLWAGVHFQSAIDASQAMCDDFGDMAYHYLNDLIAGDAPARPPSVGRPVDTLSAD